ncbi:MAG: VanZ family protein [Oceanidesulfovibrio sp.]
MVEHPGPSHNRSASGGGGSNERSAGRHAWTLFALIWLAGIALYTVLSLLPIRIPFYQPVFWGAASMDEALHFGAFAFLAVSLAFVFRSRLDLFLAYLLLLLLGTATELSHLLIPNRAFALRDLGANLFGCMAGALPGLIWRFARRVRGKGPLKDRDR